MGYPVSFTSAAMVVEILLFITLGPSFGPQSCVSKLQLYFLSYSSLHLRQSSQCFGAAKCVKKKKANHLA